MAPGGTMLVHDAYNAVGVMLAQLRLLFLSSRWRYVGRSRSLAEYRREDLAGGARLRNCGRQLRGVPWFVAQLPDQGRARRPAAPARSACSGCRMGTHWPY